MRDLSKLKNYVTKYKRYYNIEFSSNYVIHHIDFNHNNNDISNLVLLPKKLHLKYHNIINSISLGLERPIINGFIDIRFSNHNIVYFNTEMIGLLSKVIEECSKWLEYKKYNYKLGRNYNGNF